MARKIRTAVLAGVIVAGALTGCGHTSSSTKGSTSPAAGATTDGAFPTPTQTDVNGNGTPDAQDPDQAWPGKMTVVYEEAKTPDAVRGRKFMEDTNLLPQLADDINTTLKLPYDIPLRGSQCDEPNDFWSPSDKAMTLCYEDIANSLDIYQKAGDAKPAEGTFHEALAAFYHEAGHMVIDLYDLPATGREEDVADQASVYLLLRPGDDGKVDRDSVVAILDSARWFNAMNELDGGEVNFADPHSPNKARMYNMVCWAYGGQPQLTGDVVAAGLLPESRAGSCDEEYQKLDHAWNTLLTPYLKS
ncbi:DUF4344 domain-containing metallopeptidase [Mycolicibacterium sarraceniae]|uniref:Lipoprotein n=1 Tax=Mycolicibacterium sarraceniae TaxID=1534348 RepID=A0A7I7SN68_9MYCO|nr:DUF4344 domain-containing metallopeptidase [Mycolicibacterium sarraceniae]BBY58402.1 hypothetical protein MSAR_15380 [Mycolicibacterium sarraceniae]